MSKELKSFDRIKNYQVIVNVEKDEVKTISELLPSSCNEVETALKDLSWYKEQLKDFDIKENQLRETFIVYKNYQADQKKLKESQDIQSCFEDYGLSIKDIRKFCVSYKQREKHDKALDIIKEKKVDISFLFEDWEDNNEKNALWNYNRNNMLKLTKEEYELLKEVFL